MFNWFISIFTLASLVILFVTWMRAIRVKDILGDRLQKEWSALRAFIFLAFVCELVLLIFALIGLKVTFAYLSSIYLIYFSYVLYEAVNFFLKAMMPQEQSGEISEE